MSALFPSDRAPGLLLGPGTRTSRFTLSKLSCVTLRVRRGGRLVHVRKLVA